MTEQQIPRQTVLITGGARGMGAVTARYLAQRGDTVIIADCEGEAGYRLEAQLRSAGHDVHFITCNLAEKAEVQNLAQDLHLRWPKLDLLILNAGITYPQRQRNRDGMDMHMAICHLGHFLLLALLRPALAQSSMARVIFVASEGHKACGRFDLADANNQALWGNKTVSHQAAFMSYARAKLATLLTLPVWKDKLAPENIRVAAISPGYFVNTGIHREMRGIFRLGALVVFGLGQLLRLNTPERGARAHIRYSTCALAHFPDGDYRSISGPLAPSPDAEDAEMQKAVFAWSAQQCGIAMEAL